MDMNCIGCRKRTNLAIIDTEYTKDTELTMQRIIPICVDCYENKSVPEILSKILLR